MQPLLEARLLACPDLPSLPLVALRVLELCRDGDEDLGELARVIESDPAIAAKLLRLANSAPLATRGRITTLTRAIAIVGTHATVSTARSFSLVRGRRGGDAGGFDHARFWRRAVFCAMAARACLRGTDALATRGEGVLTLLFAPAPGGSEAVVRRIREHASSAGAPVAIGWAELRPGDACRSHAQLLDAAERALASSRAADGAPVRGETAPPRDPEPLVPVRPPRSPPC